MPVPKRKEFPDFKRTAQDWQRFKDNFLLYAGNSAVNFFQDSFRRKGFIDKTYEPWAKRKVVKSRGSLLLVSGRLKNSIRITRMGEDFVSVGTDVPYAKIHNEGGKVNKTVQVREHTRRLSKRIEIKSTSLKNRRTKTIKRKMKTGIESKVKAHSRKVNFEMPQRQFIGESNFLMRRLETNAFRQLDLFMQNTFR